MILLDTTSKSLEVILSASVATTQLPFMASYADITLSTGVPTAQSPASNDGATNNTTAVTMVAAPASSTTRQVYSVNVFNADSASRQVTVRLNNSSTFRILCRTTLAVGDTLMYSHGEGFRVQDTNGNIKTVAGTVATGIVLDSQFSLLQSDGTLSAASGVQTWAGTNKTAQDVFTVVANTSYRFRGQYIINTGSTTHTTALAFALSTATVASFEYLVRNWSAALNTVAAASQNVHVSGVASKVVNVTSTAVYTIVQFEGTCIVNTGGTITPQINFSANPGGTNLMKRGSWVEFIRLGTNTVVAAGPWA